MPPDVVQSDTECYMHETQSKLINAKCFNNPKKSLSRTKESRHFVPGGKKKAKRLIDFMWYIFHNYVLHTPYIVRIWKYGVHFPRPIIQVLCITTKSLNIFITLYDGRALLGNLAK
ncbi:uncharacterized protein MCYG_06757 [Microsporum canis CBS 113480]|uniref:PiggyBac transposable element-derived protein domain-containing protein n=1 Tax=Arthroderma otae (strain ATCC MYA-4605 / CBS 113480) TaxID=554155 RepID=C5FVK4_ARTOC|nr:uncharacterized protein MCYG_06757 [Microsporum canis CBS 113480]EEQ33938.1 predicted protein [Microsporum canis CBS 113480]